MEKEFWDLNAASWAKAVQSNQIGSRTLSSPAVIDEILSTGPGAVLDLGCGEGWIGKQLLQHGIEYVGLDCSAALISNARLTCPDGKFETVSYEDLTANRWSSPGQFDTAVFNFSLFGDDLVPLLRKVTTFLRPEGAIIIQTLHPCYSLKPYEDSWRTEDFSSFPVPFTGSMRWFGRTLESWFRTFAESALRVTSLREPLNSSDQMPVSLIFRLERIS